MNEMIYTASTTNSTAQREADCRECSHYPVCRYYDRIKWLDIHNICKYRDFGGEK